jgi:molybdate transport system substrate-binding protein
MQCGIFGFSANPDQLAPSRKCNLSLRCFTKKIASNQTFKWSHMTVCHKPYLNLKMRRKMIVKIYRIYLVFVALLVLSIPLSVSAESLKLYAAGSLKVALSDVASSYEKIYKAKVTTKFGPSGLLTTAIEAGENPDVFASANMTHPEKLASSGWGGPVVLFTRNQLCALAQPDSGVTTDNLLNTLMDKNVRVGISTPKADPSGDYAWDLFKKAETIKEGNFATLSGKALQLTGGPDSEKAPEGRNHYGWLMSEKKADVFLTYCTNAVLAQKEVQSLKVVRIPEDLSVGADYGLLVRNGAPNEAWRLAMYILSPDGQKILRQYGFEASAMAKEE